ncbi:MAG: stage II sporulation protein D [Lachnospiraceae bacterium]|nr:stage II sporulation protein D [Lachnospiraceae bacterium]
MKEKIKTCLAVCVLVLTIPYIVTILFQGDKTSPEPEKVEKILEKDSEETQKDGNQEMNVEEYLVGVVAKEIPLDYQTEAIKAQTVIARTALVMALETKGELPVSMSREEMLKLWGQEGFEENYRTLEGAVEATKGEILCYQKEPIHAAFHAVSAGSTRSAAEALQTKEEPYLASVDSKIDIPSVDYLKVIFMEKKEFLQKIKEICPKLETEEKEVLEKVEIIQRDKADYVTQIKVGEEIITGEEFRKNLELNSACFYIKEVEGQVRILTKGLGHGLGLSQYGANELAKEGKDYREILQYYYQEIQIEKKKR